MMMCNLHPQEVYKWFMECFVDSSDWVMGPNVFGMSQFSDGGTLLLNLILRFKLYTKNESLSKVIGAQLLMLYWRFIADHKKFLLKI